MIDTCFHHIEVDNLFFSTIATFKLFFKSKSAIVEPIGSAPIIHTSKSEVVVSMNYFLNLSKCRLIAPSLLSSTICETSS
ncbi:hypothetical protein [Methanobrevibacter oralis]|uniref:hypothetical protein n=1 Tax=Methanobrevibacter oralis TaxID=66851 RepID=UPI00164DC510|nr:hypothetical protein [Methanobrevibacter oralis]